MTHLAEPIITVRGAWHGRVTDPARVFRGKIVHSDLTGLREGTNAEVSYGFRTATAQDAGEHGTYTLVAGPRRLSLMSFTCRTVGTMGQHGTDDTDEADWQAVPLEGAS